MTQPLARTSELLATPAGDEIIVYDLRSRRVHRLNAIAARVWRLCDGGSSARQIARSLERDDAVGESAVWLALQRLSDAGLLEASVEVPDSVRSSRRTLLRSLGRAAALLPLVVSMTAPTPAQAASTTAVVNPCERPTGRPDGCPCGNSGQCASEFCEPDQTKNKAGSAAITPTGICTTICFPAGTPVLLESDARPIESIAVGEWVASFNVETGGWGHGRVTRVMKHVYTGDLITLVAGGHTIEATGHHPFRVLAGEGLDRRPEPQSGVAVETGKADGGRWVDARDLRAGDVLASCAGKLRLDSVASRTETLPVYNFSVEHTPTYAVGVVGLLVHNRTLNAPDREGLTMHR